MKSFKIKEEYIQLNQLIKAIGWVDNGAQANSIIEQGLVKVNNVIELRKRNKLVVGTIIEYNNQKAIIE